jgi:hypothetical protein
MENGMSDIHLFIRLDQVKVREWLGKFEPSSSENVWKIMLRYRIYVLYRWAGKAEGFREEWFGSRLMASDHAGVITGAVANVTCGELAD